MFGQGVTASDKQSSAKKRRLAALDQVLSKSKPGGAGKKTEQQRAGNAKRQPALLGRPGIEAASTTEDQPPYHRLSLAVREGPIAAVLQFGAGTSKGSVGDALIDELVRTTTGAAAADESAVPAQKTADRTLLLDNPTATLKVGAPRGRGPGQKGKLMSAKQRKKMHLYEIDPAHLRYELYEPLRQLWRQYAAGIMEDCKSIEERLWDMDYHGAEMKVVRCKDPRHVGVHGVVLKSSRVAFHILSKRNKLHVISKAGSTFELELDGVRVVQLQSPDKLNSQPM